MRYDRFFEGLEECSPDLVKRVKEVVTHLDARISKLSKYATLAREDCLESPIGMHENRVEESEVAAFGGAPAHKHHTKVCKFCGHQEDVNCGYMTCQ